MGQDRKDSPINNPPPPERSRSQFWNLAGLGTEFAVIILGSVYLGNWLDKTLGIAPFGILGALVFAMVFGVYYLIQRTKNA